MAASAPAQGLDPVAVRKLDQEHALRAGTRQLALDFWQWLAGGGRQPALLEAELEAFCTGLGNLELTSARSSDVSVLQHFKLELDRRTVQSSGRFIKLAEDGNAGVALGLLVEVLDARLPQVAWPSERLAGQIRWDQLAEDYATFRNYYAWLIWQASAHGRAGRAPAGTGSGAPIGRTAALDAAYLRWLAMGRMLRKGMPGQGPYAVPIARPTPVGTGPGPGGGSLGTGS